MHLQTRGIVGKAAVVAAAAVADHFTRHCALAPFDSSPLIAKRANRHRARRSQPSSWPSTDASCQRAPTRSKPPPRPTHCFPTTQCQVVE